MATVRLPVGAAIIVRNEERTLGRCLASLGDWCDEIVVIDTGSDDGTPSVARRCGATVHHTTWNDDFGASRNVALEHVRSPWAFTIDADEEVVSIDRVSVAETLQNPAAVAALVRQRPAPGYTACDELRLFRNRADLRYQRRVHETLQPHVDRITESESMCVTRVAIAIHHHGYDDPADRPRKAQRDLPLIEADLRDRPGDAYLWAAKGACLATLGRTTAAEEALRTGVRRGGDTAAVLLLQYQLDAGRVDDHLLETWLRRAPDDVDLWWIAARHHRRQGDHDRAISYLERLVAVDESELRRRSRPLAQIGEWSHELLGRSLLSLGRAAEAATAFRRAEVTAAGPANRHRVLADLAARIA